MTASKISAFLAKYSPEVRSELRAARTRLRSMFPRGYELVYDNYNALVFGFSPTESTSEAFISVAGYPKWVTLFFLRGVDLHDPKGLLQGAGKQVRSIRLNSARQLAQPAVKALIAQAMEPHREALRRGKPLQTIVRSESRQQRSRRPARRLGKAGNA